MRAPILLAILLSFVLSACPGGEKVNPEKAGDQIVMAMCKKLVSCQPKEMPNEDFCKTTLKSVGKGGLGKLDVTQKQVDSCVATIGNTDCATMMGPNVPAGCEFLK